MCRILRASLVALLLLSACARPATRPSPPPGPPAPPMPAPRVWEPPPGSGPGSLPVAASAFAHRDLPLDQVLAEVRRTNRPGLLYFCASWCGFCNKLDRLTLSRPDVQQAIRSGYVAVQYDVDTSVGRQTANRYGANGFPTLVVVDASGRAVKTLVGFRDGPGLLGALRSP